jgi:hypothetical protein
MNVKYISLDQVTPLPGREELVSVEASWTPLRGVTHGFKIISEAHWAITGF